MRRILNSPVLIEILRPLGQILVFVTATGAVLSVLILVIAFLLRGSAAGLATIENYGVDLFSYTLVNLPQVLIDGVTIGFVYAAIALGYTMVYGVLEFINFAHSEIFAIGAFVGIETLIGLGRCRPVERHSYLAGLRLAGTGDPVRDDRCRGYCSCDGKDRLPAIAGSAAPGTIDLCDRCIILPPGPYPPGGEPDNRPVLPGLPHLWKFR